MKTNKSYILQNSRKPFMGICLSTSFSHRRRPSRQGLNQINAKPCPLDMPMCHLADKHVVRVRQVSHVSFSTRDGCQRNISNRIRVCRLLWTILMQGECDCDPGPICAQEFLRPPAIVEPSEKVLDGIRGEGKRNVRW